MLLIFIIMCLLDWIFVCFVKIMLVIDLVVCFFMWEDLEVGRVMEIDWINGEVIKLVYVLG